MSIMSYAAIICTVPQTILDGHLQHFDAEISGQSSNLIKAALGLHNQVRLYKKRRGVYALAPHDALLPKT